MNKNLYIIAGCNGAGKTTASFTILPLADVVLVFDNSEGKHELIAEKADYSDLNIIDNEKFTKLRHYYDR